MNKYTTFFISLIIFILIWELYILSSGIPNYLLPSFNDILYSFFNNFNRLAYHWSFTLTEAISGFLIANIISGVISLLAFRHKFIENIVLPYAIILKTIPVIAFAPLLILWFGSGMGSRVAVVILMCFFPSLVNMLRGIKSIDTTLIQFFKVYKASPLQSIIWLVIPSTLPYLFASLKISISLAIIGAIISEFITANKGLGFLIITGYYTLDIPLVFTAIIISSLTGLFGYFLIDYLEKKVIFWSDPIH